MSPSVIVAMSGGVDSSVAAALLKAQGYDVVGVGLRFPEWMPAGESFTCCGMAGMLDARSVAAQIGIPFYVLDYRQAFTETVVEPFCRAYASGETPNPCVRCNVALKFGTLLDEALALGAEYVATGHYARIEHAEDGRVRLMRGIDRGRDQSYFLFALTPRQIAHTLFPVGGLTKVEVRRIAARFNLPVAQKPSSQDICFVGQSGYREFLAHYRPDTMQPGPLLDSAGRQLGQHRGIAAYTLGQHRGLGVASPEPLYVIDIDAQHNTVIVGPACETRTQHLVTRGVNWVSCDSPGGPLRVNVQTRYRGVQAPADLVLDDGCVRIAFDEPQALVAPGQAVVFYHDDVLLGGAEVDRADCPQQTLAHAMGG